MTIKKNVLRVKVEEVFSSYFIKHSFIEVGVRELIYKNDFVRLKFSSEFGYIDLFIKTAENSKSYPIKTLHWALHNRKPIAISHTSHNEQLNYFLAFLENDIPQLPKGDYSWKSAVGRFERESTKVLKKLWSLPLDDPMYIKFKNGDPSYYDDILTLL